MRHLLTLLLLLGCTVSNATGQDEPAESTEQGEPTEKHFRKQIQVRFKLPMTIGPDGFERPAEVFGRDAVYAPDFLESVAADLIGQLEVEAGFLDYEPAGADPVGYLLEIRLEVNSDQKAHTTKFVIELTTKKEGDTTNWTLGASTEDKKKDSWVFEDKEDKQATSWEFEDDLKVGSMIKPGALKELVNDEFSGHLKNRKSELLELLSNLNFLDDHAPLKMRTWVRYFEADSTLILPLYSTDFGTEPKGLGLRLGTRARDARTGKQKNYPLNLSLQSHKEAIGDFDDDDKSLTDDDYTAWSDFVGVSVNTYFGSAPLRERRLIAYIDGDDNALTEALKKEDEEVEEGANTGAWFTGLHVTDYTDFKLKAELLDRRSPTEVLKGLSIFEGVSN